MTVKKKKRCRNKRVAWGLGLFMLLFLAGILGRNMVGEKEKNPSEIETEIGTTKEQNTKAANKIKTEGTGEGENRKEEDWYLTLVNSQNKLPKDWEVKLKEVESGEMVDERIYDALEEMLQAAWEEGLGPIVVSGYRTAKRQQSIMDDKIKDFCKEGYTQEQAAELTGQWVALPGYSEHQLGLAVDINGSVFEIYSWLKENSYKYGFIHRYPEEKAAITGISGERWHYRYVGVEAATLMYEQGICLEEYVGIQK